MEHLTTFEMVLAIVSAICLIYGGYQYFKMIMR